MSRPLPLLSLVFEGKTVRALDDAEEKVAAPALVQRYVRLDVVNEEREQLVLLAHRAFAAAKNAMLQKMEHVLHWETGGNTLERLWDEVGAVELDEHGFEGHDRELPSLAKLHTENIRRVRYDLWLDFVGLRRIGAAAQAAGVQRALRAIDQALRETEGEPDPHAERLRTDG